MTNKLITLADLDERLLDYINGLQAQINRMAELSHVPPGTLQTAALESTARFQRQRAASERNRLNREQLEDDRKAFTSWAKSAQFIYADAEEWKREADLEWKSIVGRNGSEHGQAYLGSYREPTQKELLAALEEYGKWENSDNPQYAHHRSIARQALPMVRKKLAAALLSK